MHMHRLARSLLKGAVQMRAADILDHLISEGPTAMSDLIGDNPNPFSVRKAVQWLRENDHAHVCGYRGEVPEMIITAGAGIDAPRPKRGPETFKQAPRDPFAIPAPDPVLAALFGRA